MVVKKYKISISVDEETLLMVGEGIRSGRFRNRSHAFEQAIRSATEVPR
ncbi:hypothetical protein JXB02_01560 [Candidatus Woesearchaeota archaeon]|nr:hypothetical protein [Candidatus Woesearchaeota archaeon]